MKNIGRWEWTKLWMSAIICSQNYETITRANPLWGWPESDMTGHHHTRPQLPCACGVLAKVHFRSFPRSDALFPVQTVEWERKKTNFQISTTEPCIWKFAPKTSHFKKPHSLCSLIPLPPVRYILPLAQALIHPSPGSVVPHWRSCRLLSLQSCAPQRSCQAPPWLNDERGGGVIYTFIYAGPAKPYKTL